MNYKITDKTLFITLVLFVSLVSGRPAFSYGSNDVNGLYRTADTHEKYNHSVKRIHEDVLTRLEMIRAVKEEEMRTRIVDAHRQK
ncbi:MAG: hypothetical protein HKN08_12380 [Gammaproteobacteria bacterium]|nr:hypothetical protein [Gammaproteobacteria bacterium]